MNKETQLKLKEFTKQAAEAIENELSFDNARLEVAKYLSPEDKALLDKISERLNDRLEEKFGVNGYDHYDENKVKEKFILS